MSSKLMKQPATYSDSTPETRYSRAEQVWAEREGSHKGEARMWRIFALCVTLALILLTAGMIYLISQRHVELVITQVDRTGMPIATALAEPNKPDITAVRWLLAETVKDVRSLYEDPVAIRMGWEDAYNVLTQSAQAQLTAIAREQNISDEINRLKVRAPDRITRMVEIRAFIPVSPDTYQLRWMETTFNAKGMQVAETNWTGQFVVEYQPPLTIEDAYKRPLGLIIKDLSIVRDFK